MLPVFTVEDHASGYVIQASWANGVVEHLIGVFTSKKAAQDWLDEGGGRRWAQQQRQPLRLHLAT